MNFVIIYDSHILHELLQFFHLIFKVTQLNLYSFKRFGNSSFGVLSDIAGKRKING